MPKINEGKYFRDAFALDDPKTARNLKSWFGKVEKGNDEIYDTPFAKGESTPVLLERWISYLKSIRNEWPSLFEFEIDLSKKVGPMSIEKPLSERLSDIDSYYEGVLLPSEPIDDSAVSAVVKELSSVRGLEPRNVRATVEKMKKSTNSGSPYFTKKRTVVEETIPFTLNAYGDGVYQALPTGSYSATAILGWRGQEGGPTSDDVKQRVIWMFPFSVNIAELQVYQPLIEQIQRFNIFSPWVGMEEVDDRITRMFDTKRKSDLVVCTDFTKFDQHFNPVMQKAALQVLTAIMNNTDESTQWLNNVFPIKYHIPLAYDWGKVRFGSHGMGSGSGGTNADETLAHRALQYEAAQAAGEQLNPNSQCLGDDGCLTYPGCTVDDIVKAYSSHGLEMNLDKQYASTQDCVFLRRWHHQNYRVDGRCAGVYSTCRALGRLRYLERYMNPKYWDAKAVALRQLAILENVKYHPLKEEFVKFCMKRDKYRLGLDIPHFFSDIRSIAQEKIGDMPEFLGYTKTLQSKGDPVGGIESWWIVKYLQTLK